MVVVQLSAAMSILNYFKPKDGLPDPKGPLSQSLSSRAITAANNEVAKVIGGSASQLHAEVIPQPGLYTGFLPRGCKLGVCQKEGGRGCS